jgi:hypothetical protein
VASLFKALYEYADGKIEFRALPGKTGDQRRETAFFDLADGRSMLAWVKRQVAARKHVYFGVATRDGKAGKKENIVSIPAVWCDIDFKETPQAEADELLNQFLLPPTVLVHSGGGYHVYWIFNEPVGQEDIPRLEETLKRIAVVLKGDMKATDASRILRVPETLNVKYDPPAKVKVVSGAWGRVNLEDFDFLDSVEIPANVSSMGDYQPDAITHLLERCAFMRHCVENAATLPEPLWYAAITQLVRFPGGREKIHEISKPYPKYSRKETDEKILHALGTGPMTCAKIRESWNCPQNCPVTAPACLALGRVPKEAQNANLTPSGDFYDRVKAWVTASPGMVSLSDIDREFGFTSPEQRQIRSGIVKRMVDEGLVDDNTSRRNTIRVRNLEEKKIVLGSSVYDCFKCTLPFELEKYVEITQKNIIVIAGETNTGKTAVLLDMAYKNQRFCPPGGKTTYFSSEMGEQEVNRRTMSLGKPQDWAGVEFIDRASNFDDLIRSDPARRNGINFIDYLEPPDGEAFRVGNDIKKIYDSLDRGICIIAIQKKPGVEHGVGGFDTLSKARLYLMLSRLERTEYGLIGACKVAKAKFIKHGQPSCDGKEVDYIIDKQGHPGKLTDWQYVNKGFRKEKLATYKKFFGVEKEENEFSTDILNKYITGF